MNLRSPLDTLEAVAMAVELFEPIAFELARCAAFELVASLRAAGEAGDWLVVAVERLVLLAFAAPGDGVCAQTAAAMQNDAAPTMRAGIERRLMDMISSDCAIAGSRPRATTPREYPAPGRRRCERVRSICNIRAEAPCVFLLARHAFARKHDVGTRSVLPARVSEVKPSSGDGFSVSLLAWKTKRPPDGGAFSSCCPA